jgi:hypothetical protein
MTFINRPISELNKQEFVEAYNEMLVAYEDKLDKRPLPMAYEVLQVALSKEEISKEKYIELMTT